MLSLNEPSNSNMKRNRIGWLVGRRIPAHVCPRCRHDELRRIRTLWHQKLLRRIGIPVKRYLCDNCGWRGGRIAAPTTTQRQSAELQNRITTLKEILDAAYPKRDNHQMILNELYARFGKAGYEVIPKEKYEVIVQFLDKWLDLASQGKFAAPNGVDLPFSDGS